MIRGTPTDSDRVRAKQLLSEICGEFELQSAKAGLRSSFVQEGCLVGEDELSDSARQLLAHDRHMTPTLRKFFGEDLSLHVLAERTDGSLYRRCIHLSLAQTGTVVEFGIVRLDTGVLEPSARAAVLERGRPLGDILIGFGILTRVEVRWFMGWDPPHGLLFPLAAQAGPVFGRLATIHCDGRAAIDLLEVVTNDPGEQTVEERLRRPSPNG